MRQENKEAKLDWRVEAMKLSKDKTSLFYNDFLTLNGIPPEVYDYRLGNRSALEWVIDQYRVTRDEKGGIAATPTAWTTSNTSSASRPGHHRQPGDPKGISALPPIGFE